MVLQEMVNIKLESIAAYYNRLLTTQLRHQYEYFENQIAEVDHRASQRLAELARTIEDVQAAVDADVGVVSGREQQVKTVEKKVSSLRARLHKLEQEERFLRDLNSCLSATADATLQATIEEREAIHREHLGKTIREKDKRIEALRAEFNSLVQRL